MADIPFLFPILDPIRGGNLAQWGPNVDEIAIQIRGPKADRLNQLGVRSRARLASTSPNADICVARAIMGIFSTYQARFARTGTAFAPLGGAGMASPLHT